jgi:hypothetical protein
MVMTPLECVADLGVSIKVFIPFLYNKLLVLDCKVFCLRKFTRARRDPLDYESRPYPSMRRFAEFLALRFDAALLGNSNRPRVRRALPVKRLRA